MTFSIRENLVALAFAIFVPTTTGAVRAQEKPQPPSAPPNVTIGNITSANQGSGLTAGYVGSVNVLPSLVRGPLLERFKREFSAGARILRDIKRDNLTDDQIVDVCKSADKWTQETAEWLKTAVSDYASERFQFVTPLSLMYFDGKQHSDAATKCRTAWLNWLPGALQNVDMLMREPSLYPAPPTSSASTAKPVQTQ